MHYYSFIGYFLVFIGPFDLKLLQHKKKCLLQMKALPASQHILSLLMLIYGVDRQCFQKTLKLILIHIICIRLAEQEVVS